MKSYVLAVVVTMFLSALFAFQNIGDVTVRFLIFEWTLPQGVWEVLLFCSGAALMWIFSIFSMFEQRGKYKKQLREKDDLIKAAEADKKTILESMAAASSRNSAADSQAKDAEQHSDKPADSDAKAKQAD